jgi:phage tail-like protein
MDTMPLVYREDPLAEQLCDSFDEMLAPVFATLDCFPAYLDPKTTPEDMLEWLAGWIGLDVGQQQEPNRKRELIIAATALLPWRGTVRAIREAVRATFNQDTEVVESGAATWSDKPNSRAAGQPVPNLLVRLTVDHDVELDRRSLDALVESVKPAHIPHTVEVVTRPAPPKPVSNEPPPKSPDGDGGAPTPTPPGDGDGDGNAPARGSRTAAISRSDPDSTTVIPMIDPSSSKDVETTDGDGDGPPRDSDL